MGEAAIRYLELIDELGRRSEGTGSNPARESELAGELDQLWSRMTADEQAQVEHRLASFPDPSR